LARGDHRHIHTRRVREPAVGADESGAIDSAGGNDVEGVMDGQVVAQLPRLDEQRSDRDDGKGPISEDFDEPGYPPVVEDTGEAVSTQDLGHFDVEMLYGPKLGFFLVALSSKDSGDGLAFGGPFHDVDPGGGVEHVPDGHC
jgi:hypothetical protein